MRAGKTELRGTSREGHTANRRRGWIGKLRSTATQRGGWAARLVTTIAAIAALAVLATPVAADDLVSNLGEMGLVGTHADYMLSVNNFVMPFTTGTNTSGYRLESISIEFATSGSRTHDPVYVSLLPDNGSGQIATLTKNGINYLGPVAGVNKYSVWRAQCYPQPPHGGGCISRASSAHLDPNTTYWVYIWAGWGWIFAAVEHWNAECVGWHVCKVGSRFAALDPIAQGLERLYGSLDADVARGLALRMDHGSQYLSDHFLKQIRYWGIHPSFGFVEEPETNGVAERWNRTLKEQAIHGRIFQNLEAVRAAVADFVERYNQTWRLEKLGYHTPIEAREEYELRQAA